MSAEGADRSQLRLREFMSLLPLTLEIAGLAKCEPGKFFNEGQLENRANIVRQAFKVAKQLVVEITRSPEGG